MHSTFVNYLMKRKDLIRPELQQIRNYYKIQRILPALNRLTDQMQLQCLIFNNNRDSATWFMLSAYGISIDDYKELYNAQHKEDIEFKYPNTVTGFYDLKPFKRYDHHGKPYEKMLYSVNVKDEDIKQIERQNILSEHEKQVNWCQFCRGMGIIQCLIFDDELIHDNIPTPVLKLRCFHLSQTVENYSKYNKKKTL